MKRVWICAVLASLFFVLGLYFFVGVIQAGSFDGIGGYTHERAMFNANYWGSRAMGSFFVALIFGVASIIGWIRQRKSRRSAA
jgi:hypothetical protein